MAEESRGEPNEAAEGSHQGEAGRPSRREGGAPWSWAMWGILGQWDILLLNLTSIGFTIFLDVSSLTFPFLQMLML